MATVDLGIISVIKVKARPTLLRWPLQPINILLIHFWYLHKSCWMCWYMCERLFLCDCIFIMNVCAILPIGNFLKELVYYGTCTKYICIRSTCHRLRWFFWIKICLYVSVYACLFLYFSHYLLLHYHWAIVNETGLKVSLN